MAEYTGGKFYKARSKEELLAIFRDIYMSLRYYYLITYVPPTYWGYHKVRTDLSLEGRRKPLKGYAEYDTSELFPWSDLSEIFERPINFEFDQAALKPESQPIINEIIDAMLSRPTLRLEVQGHTDNLGSNEYNQKLSEERAAVVRAAIMAGGIEANRLRSRGFGASEPVATNDTEEGRARNRRTQFEVIGK
jgi:outer membrane protein OmpA-like peptidoglycan-associated protein